MPVRTTITIPARHAEVTLEARARDDGMIDLEFAGSGLTLLGRITPGEAERLSIHLARVVAEARHFPKKGGDR